MWNWYDYTIDSNGNVKYYKCKRCKSFPAISLTFQDDNEYGPYCKDCWWIHTEEQFELIGK